MLLEITVKQFFDSKNNSNSTFVAVKFKIDFGLHCCFLNF